MMGMLEFFRLRFIEPQATLVSEEKLLASLMVMAWVVEARDPYTGGHLWRVSRFSRLLAQHAGMPELDVSRTPMQNNSFTRRAGVVIMAISFTADLRPLAGRVIKYC